MCAMGEGLVGWLSGRYTSSGSKRDISRVWALYGKIRNAHRHFRQRRSVVVESGRFIQLTLLLSPVVGQIDDNCYSIFSRFTCGVVLILLIHQIPSLMNTLVRVPIDVEYQTLSPPQ